MEMNELEKLVRECINEQKKIGLKPAENIKVFIDYCEDIHFGLSKTANGAAAYLKTKDYGVLLINSISLENLDVNQVKTILHHELLHLNLTPSKNILTHTKQSWKKFVKLSKKIEEAYPQYKMQESIVPEIFLPENKGKEVKTHICPVCGHRYVDLTCYDANICGICRTSIDKKYLI